MFTASEIDSILADTGQPVTYKGQTVRVCFRLRYRRAELSGDVAIESTVPAAIGKTTDFADAAHGDTIDVDGVTYYVLEIQPGDDGFTRLILSRDTV